MPLIKWKTFQNFILEDLDTWMSFIKQALKTTWPKIRRDVFKTVCKRMSFGCYLLICNVYWECNSLMQWFLSRLWLLFFVLFDFNSNFLIRFGSCNILASIIIEEIWTVESDATKMVSFMIFAVMTVIWHLKVFFQ